MAAEVGGGAAGDGEGSRGGEPGEERRVPTEGGKVDRDEYHSADIATTVYHKLGLPHDLIAYSPDGRPVRLVEGRPIAEWM